MENLEKAKVNLVLENPFFATLLLEARIVITEEIPTMAVDGGETIYVNPKFLSALRVKEIEGCLAHEVLHLALRHFAREEGRERKKWNIATDLAINSFLISMKFTLPKNVILPDHFNFEWYLSAEEYYKSLEKLKVEEIEGGFDIHFYGKRERDMGDGGEKGREKVGDGRDIKSEARQNKCDFEKKWKSAIIRASTLARLQGKLPGMIQEMVDGLLTPSLNWKELLRDFVSSTIVVGGADWFRPDRRFLKYGIILPSRREKRIELIVAVDTSGSISNRELSLFFSEINNILNSAGFYSVFLIQADADIQDIREINFPERLEIKQIKVKGRGGTDFRPVFEWALRNCRRPLIYFTDLCGTFPEYLPPFPVLWVTVTEKRAPFGRTIRIEDN